MSDELDKMIRKYGQDLGRAQRQAGPRIKLPARRIAIVGAAAGLALGLVVAALPGSDPGGGTAYAVEQTRKALDAGDAILHYTLREQDPSLPTGATPEPILRERWYAASPDRYRERLTAAGGGASLTAEMAIARGRQQSWQTGDARVLDEPQPQSGSDNDVLINDPVVQARELLASGKIEDKGETQLNGRAVRRLVGTRSLGLPGEAPDSVVSEYLVDAKTFIPVEIRVTVSSEGRTSAPSVTTVQAFERLPRTPENEQLLELQAPAGVPTVKRD